MAYTFTQRIADTVKAALKNTARTQTELADHLGITQPNISRRLRGEQPFRLEEIAGIADFFGTTVEAVIGGRAAGNSGQHTVSPAPTHMDPPRASREAESGKDRPAATEPPTEYAS